MTALLIDVGGTLIDPAEPVDATYLRFGEPFGVTAVDFRAAWAAPWSGPRQVGDGRPFWRHLVSTATGCSDPDYFEALYAHYATAGAWTVRPGFRQLLADCPRVAIVSNFDTRLRPLLASLGLRYDVLACSGEQGVEKPDPRLFAHALDGLGVPAERALMVGDDPLADLDAAGRLGCRTLAAPCSVTELRHALNSLT